MDIIFNKILNMVEDVQANSEALSIAIDDTRIRKKGRKVFGAKWDRDPLGPPFSTNFIWAQRFLQFSAMLPEKENELCRARAVPIDFKHCPTVPKPKKTAPQEEWDKWKQESKLRRLPFIAHQRLCELRKKTDKKIIASVDGGYTNSTFIKNLPENTAVIGRIRKDAKIFSLPNPKIKSRGRKLIYGKQIKTPEELRKDETIKWIDIQGFAAGKKHTFNIKLIEPIRWKGSGEKNLRLIIIRPLAYRLTKKSRLLYRDPAYLICTDPSLSLEEILKNYIWRWEIEVNFRDEKSLLGIGEAQTRTPSAAALVPEFKVAAYASLLLSSIQTFGFEKPKNFVQPKWQKQKDSERISTQQMIAQMRASLWGKTLGIENKSGFANQQVLFENSPKFDNSLLSAICFV